MINTETYQKNVGRMIQLVQELLIISSEGFWLTSDLMFESIPLISDPTLRKACETCLQDRIKLEQKVRSVARQNGTVESGHYEYRRYFIDHLSENDLDELIKLKTYGLLVKDGKLYFTSRNTPNAPNSELSLGSINLSDKMIKKRINPDSIITIRDRSIQYYIEKFSLYQQRLETGETGFELIALLMGSAEDINETMKELYGGERFYSDQQGFGGCEDYHEIKYDKLHAAPQEILVHQITLGEDTDQIDLHGDVAIIIEETNYLLRWIQESFIADSKYINSIPKESDENIETQPNPFRWKGTDADLIDLFTTLRKKHYIEASSDYEVMKQLVRHFSGKGNKSLKVPNLKSALAQRKNSRNEPFECIPQNTKPENEE